MRSISSILKGLALALPLAFGAVALFSTTSTDAQPAAAKATFKIDGVHSAIIFKIKHFNVGYSYGRFNEFDGTLTYDEKNPAASSLSIEVATASVDTNNKKRDQHLAGPDFFNAKQFPKITFTSKSVKALGGPKFELAGDLTLNGITKPVTAVFEKTGEGKDSYGGYRIGGEATFTVNRTDFGITYGGDTLGKEVYLTVALEAVRQ